MQFYYFYLNLYLYYSINLIFYFEVIHEIDLLVVNECEMTKDTFEEMYLKKLSFDKKIIEWVQSSYKL